jgi:hypothetical protein
VVVLSLVAWFTWAPGAPPTHAQTAQQKIAPALQTLMAANAYFGEDARLFRLKVPTHFGVKCPVISGKVTRLDEAWQEQSGAMTGRMVRLWSRRFGITSLRGLSSAAE